MNGYCLFFPQNPLKDFFMSSPLWAIATANNTNATDVENTDSSHHRQQKHVIIRALLNGTNSVAPFNASSSTYNSKTANSTNNKTLTTAINAATGAAANSSHHILDGSPKYRLLRQQGSRPSRHLPDTLIIGVKKSGTRALLEFIRLHPDVRAAGCEVHFFDRHYQKGLNWYRHHMPYTIEGQITMEKTPSYYVTKEVPQRVHSMNPNIK